MALSSLLQFWGVEVVAMLCSMLESSRDSKEESEGGGAGSRATAGATRLGSDNREANRTCSTCCLPFSYLQKVATSLSNDLGNLVLTVENMIPHTRIITRAS